MVETVQERETILKEIQTAVRHTAVYGMGNVLVKALGFFMLPFYTHYLNPVDYGILEILDLSMTLFGLAINMGLVPAFLRCYAAAESAAEKRKVVSTGCLFVSVTGLLTFLAGLGLVRPASTLIFGPQVPATYVMLSFAALILSWMANLPRTYLRALEASGTYTIVDILTVLLLLTLNIVFIAVFKLGLVGILLSSVIVAALQLILLAGWALSKVGIGFSRPYLRQMLGFGLPLIFSNFGLFVLNFSDRFFLQHLRSLDVVGIYAVGYKFGFMLNALVIQSFFVMWQSRMYAIHAQPQHPKIFRQIFVLYALVLIFAGLVLSLFSPEIVRVMVSPKFAASRDVIPLVVLSYIFYGLGYYAQLGLFLTDRTNLVGMIGAAGAVLNLALNYLLILHYGMMGAAWATLLSFVAMAAGSYCLAQRVFPLPLGVGRVAVMMMLGTGFYLFSRSRMDSLGIALLTKVSLLFAFIVVVWKGRILSSAEVATVIAARDYALGSVSRLIKTVSGRELSQEEHV